MSDRGIPTVSGLSDVDLDAIVACLPDCVEVYGPYRPRHAPECRYDEIEVLVAEVRRLRARERALEDDSATLDDEVEDLTGRLGDAQFGWAQAALDRDAALAERDRLRDGIAAHREDVHSQEWIGNPADERLWALLDDQEDDRG